MPIVYAVLVWAAHFTTLYAFTALACARRFAASQWLGVSVVGWIAVIATLLALAANVAIAVHALRIRGPIAWLGTGVAALAALGIVWVALPILMVTPCA
jgi:hypothetical protein